MAKRASKKKPSKTKKPALKIKASARRPRATASASRTPAPRTPAPRAPPQPKWKPPGMHDLVTNLVFKNTVAAIEFYQAAFGATEQMRMMAPDGSGVWHAELKIGDSLFFLNDEMPQSTAAAAGPNHKPTATLQLYVPDCDAVLKQALQAGAKPGMPVADMFWGDRMGSVVDPFGQIWMISTRVRALTEEQMRKGGEEFVERMKQQEGMQQPPPANP